MAITVARILNRARDQHPALSKVVTPLPLACRYLTDCVQELTGELVTLMPALVAVDLVVPLPLADFAAGINLTDEIPGGWLDPLEGSFTYVNSGAPASTTPGVNVPWEQRNMRQRIPSFTLRNNIVYFLGAEQFYANFSAFTLTYTALPADFDGSSAEIPLPDDAGIALSRILAAWFLGRLLGDPQYRVDQAAVDRLDAQAERARQQFTDRIWHVTQRQSYRVRDVRGGDGGGGLGSV